MRKTHIFCARIETYIRFTIQGGISVIKKIALILFLASSLLFIPTFRRVEATTASPTETMVIHYFRYGADYDDGWNMWLWPANGAGAAYQFDTDQTGVVTDDFGAVATIDLTTNFASASSIGIIMRQGEWVKKDVDKDRFITVPATTADGTLHVYFVEGDERIGYAIDDPAGPDRSDKIVNAYFSTLRTIRFTLTSVIASGNINLKVNGVDASFTIALSANTGTITIPSNVNLENTYTLEVLFGSELKTYDVTFDGIYDTTAFIDAYGYDGDDLGAVVNASTTDFRVWAPISSSVVLKIYDSGTPARLLAKDAAATDTPSQTVAMTKSVKGTWTASLPGNLHGKYYTYTVTNGIKTNELVDPYAKSCGINGLRGMVVDFSQTNPAGFTYGDRPGSMLNYTDAIIYEVHVRDLTSHSSWVVASGQEAYRGKFLGFTVEGTTYQGVSTGIDHIKELGVTHVQILPFFDYGAAVDESGSATQFNWGYMPLNFNCLEGHYSTNPYNGAVRVNEFKQLMATMSENGLRVVMDVVYNHTGQSGDSNFSMILPGYYYRMNGDGSFSNGSGTGNETASERYMMRKFMVDSVTFWAEEYNISGFRFDLMALHDVDTMNQIVAALHEIDDTILVYGEPWTGGGTPLSASIAADKANLVDMPGVAAFNDDFRNAVKGNPDGTEDGFVQDAKTTSIINRLKYGVAGGVQLPGITTEGLSWGKFWNDNPSQTLNYVTAHDNLTLFDKLTYTATFAQKSGGLIKEMQKQANALVLTAQGIPFLHAGEEFLRSKPCVAGDNPDVCVASKYNRNSYQSPDAVNQLRWDLKAQDDNMEVFEYYKDLIELRKAHPAFRLSTAAEVEAHLSFIDFDDNSVLGYTISDYANGDSWDTILVIHNTGEFATVTLPAGDTWNLVGNQDGIGTDVIQTYAGGASMFVMENETVVLYQGVVVVPEEPDTGCNFLGFHFGSVFYSMGAICLAFFVLIRKKH